MKTVLSVLGGTPFDTPISPISQSIYGRKVLSFSQVRAFKEAGYRTIFLTGCPEPWRQINDTFKFYGFEEIYGQAAIGEKFPNAEKSPWGIGDKWMFKFAEDLLKEAEGTGRPVFIMMLSTTNHPPFKVPDGEKVSKVDLKKLPKIVNIEDLTKATWSYFSRPINTLQTPWATLSLILKIRDG